MLINRILMPHLLELAKSFPAIAIMGPRQSGKTTLAKQAFPHYAYVTLEDLDMRMAAQEDPRSFFDTYAKKDGLIIDEIQEVPELLSYMQGIIDQAHKPGRFIITGSQHFLMYEKITQTLAGRIALLTLLPLSVDELKEANLLPDTIEPLLIKGFYPRLYSQIMPVQIWYANYISTYVEKDVRQILNISDVVKFQKFIKLCAARVGNLINYADLARDCGITPHTAKDWISVLEASFIIKIVTPYHNNFSKRLVKSPKLYFYDTALICALLGIKTEEDLLIHPFKGAIFESFVMSELFKHSFNKAELPNLYFWRDTQGKEIDCIIEKAFGVTIPIEIKARKTIVENFFETGSQWKSISNQPTTSTYIIYSGNETVHRKTGTAISWKNISEFIDSL